MNHGSLLKVLEGPWRSLYVFGTRSSQAIDINPAISSVPSVCDTDHGLSSIGEGRQYETSMTKWVRKTASTCPRKIEFDAQKQSRMECQVQCPSSTDRKRALLDAAPVFWFRDLIQGLVSRRWTFQAYRNLKWRIWQSSRKSRRRIYTGCKRRTAKHHAVFELPVLCCLLCIEEYDKQEEWFKTRKELYCHLYLDRTFHHLSIFDIKMIQRILSLAIQRAEVSRRSIAWTWNDRSGMMRMPWSPLAQGRQVIGHTLKWSRFLA